MRSSLKSVERNILHMLFGKFSTSGPGRTAQTGGLNYSMSDLQRLDNLEKIFEEVSKYCERQISDVSHSLFIQGLCPVGFEDGTVFLRIETKYRADALRERYLNLLGEAFRKVLGYDVEIDIVSDEELGVRQPFMKEDLDNLPDEYEYTFETFVVGSSNKFAHAASLAVAINPSKAYNPLFIYGDSGLGKTHLLSAIRTEIGASYPNKKQIFVHGEAFANELIGAIQDNSTVQFRDKYRAADVLLVDDVQFIGGKERTQEEFFHTFNSLYQDHKQIIMTSDRPPKEIKTLEDRLRTRFEWGLLADVQAPDFETRTAIILRKAEQIEFEIPADTAEYIANKLKNNIRQLEGAVKKLKAYKLLQGLNPTIAVAQNTIKDVLQESVPIPVTIEKILTEVARTYGVTVAEIRSNKRAANISTARQTSAFIIKEVTGISLADIGKDFGNRDHSTMVYSVQQAQRKMDADSHYKEVVEDIIRNIKGS